MSEHSQEFSFFEVSKASESIEISNKFWKSLLKETWKLEGLLKKCPSKLNFTIVFIT